MKKEQALELMNAIPPDLIEEADLQAPARQPMPKIVRTGLIAACLCLALLGTAFAANPEAVAALMERLNVQVISDQEYYGADICTIGGQVTAFPLSDFSPALNEDSENRGVHAVVQKEFDTWDETRAYLGENIPCIWPNDGKNWEARYCIDMFHTQRYIGTSHTQFEQLWGIEVYSTNLELQAEVTFNIYTEHWPYPNGTDNVVPLNGLHISMDSVEQLESYSMANGLTAEILVDTEAAESAGENPPHCNAIGYFMRSGIFYRVETLGVSSNREETVARLYSILDTFP